MTGVESSKAPRASPEPPPHADPHVRAHSDLTVHGRQDHGRQGERTPRSRRQGNGGRPARVRTQRGAGRPLRIGQDDAGGGSRADAGAVNRAGRVEDGTTVSDYDEIEHRQQRSVQLSLVPVEWDGIKINLLDTPGYADFVGELRAGLRAADAALFVVSAVGRRATAPTRMVWEECAAVGMPRAVVVTHLETARADFDEMTADLRGGLRRRRPRRRAAAVPAAARPAGPDGHAPVTGLIGLLSQQLFDYSSGERKETEPGPSQLPLIEEARNRLIEGIIAESEDETLMDRYLGGEEIDVKTLDRRPGDGRRARLFYPVLAAAPAAEGARQGLGTVELLELVTGGFPTPLEHEVPARHHARRRRRAPR